MQNILSGQDSILAIWLYFDDLLSNHLLTLKQYSLNLKQLSHTYIYIYGSEWLFIQSVHTVYKQQRCNWLAN